MKKLTKEERNREQNRKYKTLIKNDFKKFKYEFDNGNKENFLKLSELLVIAQKNIDKSVGKKIIHKNNAARKKSRLFRMFNLFSNIAKSE